MPSISANVTGVVQGVGFRFFVMNKASSYNLRGYTRNLPNGDVEVYAEGDRDRLLHLVDDLNKGPSFSNVQNVQVTWSDAERGLKDFSIRH